MKKRLFFIFIFLGLVLSACSTKPKNPEDILLSFNKALNENDLDEALSYIADDVKFKFLSEHSYASKDELEIFLEAYMVLYSESRLTNLKTEGNQIRANLELDVLSGGKKILGPLTIIVEENQITEYIFGD